VDSPDAPRRPISLAECICLALENGRTGENYDRPGAERRTSVTGLRRLASPSSNTDSIRVLAVDAAISATEIEQSLARFDAIWRNSITWTAVQRPPNVTPDQIPIVAVGVVSRQLDDVQFRSEILKPLDTGGVAGITFRTDYARANVGPGDPTLNPAYQPGIDFRFEQPLLQGAGVLINDIRDALPTPLRVALPSQSVPSQLRTPGILLARLNTDQDRLEFERRIQDLLLSVEEAYWDLVSAYWELYSRDNGLRMAQLAWQIGKQRFEAGGIGSDDLAQLEEQYHFFRTQRLEALGRGTGGRPGVLEAERRLRYVVGLPGEDGCRLLPSDAPTTVPVTPDWCSAAQKARELRPELKQVELDIQATLLSLERARDWLLPDLRFTSRYGINGLDRTLGGSLSNMVSHNAFSNWDLGLQLEVPIGTRAAHAEVTRAKLQLAQRYTFLRDQEEKLLLSLQRSYRDLIQFREEILTRRSQREALAVQVKARYEKFKGGKESIDLLVRTQRNWADALRDEYFAIARYNIALADFERQKGTILAYHNVTIAEGEAPAWATPHPSKCFAAVTQAQVAQARSAPAPPGPVEQAAFAPALQARPTALLEYLAPEQPQAPPASQYWAQTSANAPPPARREQP
jgi:outer membrane protein TolC